MKEECSTAGMVVAEFTITHRFFQLKRKHYET